MASGLFQCGKYVNAIGTVAIHMHHSGLRVENSHMIYRALDLAKPPSMMEARSMNLGGKERDRQMYNS